MTTLLIGAMVLGVIFLILLGLLFWSEVQYRRSLKQAQLRRK